MYTLFQFFGPAPLPLKRSENASEKLSAEVVCCKDLPDIAALLLKYRSKQLEPRFDWSSLILVYTLRHIDASKTFQQMTK